MKSFLLTGLIVQFAYSRSKEICCQEYGCFADNPPYNGQPLPMCPQEFRPTLTMYNKLNRVYGEELTSAAVPKMFNESLRTMYIVHGWMNSDDTRWMGDMRAAFLNREDCNVVLVDWHRGADLLLYPNAAANTRSLAAYLSKSFEALVSAGGSYGRLWCLGHSLGAHACGQAGMNSGGLIARATGMDPAGPWFEYSSDLTVGINPKSAVFVDIMHTSNVYGTYRPMGHIDFYPDGGKTLSTCTTDVCAHNTAPILMIDSIYSDCYKARYICPKNQYMPRSCSYCLCDSEPCAYMGYSAERSCIKSGIFYLETNRKQPYCQN